MALTLTGTGQGGVFTLRGGSFGGRFQASVTPPPPLLLDAYPSAEAAYSLRKLRTAYTGAAIRVVSSGVGTPTLDIGFVNNVLDITTLQTFIGANTGYVTIWYDQSGNGNNATELNVNNAPKIIISSVLQTQNSKPVIKFDGTALNFTTPIGPVNTNMSIFMTAKGDSTSQIGPILGGSGAPTVVFGSYNSTDAPTLALGGGLNGSYNWVYCTTNYNTSNYTIFNGIVNSTNYYIYQNNNAFTIAPQSYSPNPTSFAFLGKYFNASSFAKFAEVVIYKTDQLSNRTGIVSNTNTYYNVF